MKIIPRSTSTLEDVEMEMDKQSLGYWLVGLVRIVSLTEREFKQYLQFTLASVHLFA